MMTESEPMPVPTQFSSRRELLIGAAAVPALWAAVPAEPVRVVPLPARGIQPQAAVSKGILHLIYFKGDAGRGDVFYTRSNDFGGAFVPPIRVNSQEGSAIATGAIRGAQISVGKQDRVHVAWNGSDAATPKAPINPASGKPGVPMLYARMDDARAAFEPQRNLLHDTFDLDGGGSIASDDLGNVYVGWHGNTPGSGNGESGREIWIAKSEDDGRTFAKERAALQQQTGTCGCCALKLFVDSRGEIYGLYRSATEGVHRDIYLLRSPDHGKSFSAGLLHKWNVNACPMSSMAFSESAGEILGAWETQTQIYYAPLNRGSDAARVSMIAPPGTNPKRKYPSIARNRKGETLLAWVDGAGWQKGGTLGWQIFDRSGRPTEASATRRDVAVWSFPAAIVRPDDGFTILA